MWNQGSMYDNFNIIRFAYNNTKPEEFPSSCVKCGLCESLCPQNISIIDDLVQAAKDIDILKNK